MNERQAEALAAYVVSLRPDWSHYPVRARIKRMSFEDNLSSCKVHTTVLNAVFNHPEAALTEFDINFQRRGAGQFRSGSTA
ncbi:hypothetical protein [Pseudarthrobacter sp. NamE5]|uniref:hypothetical protein n=1 Tax=Pseudarthrobacter sp. NamE5 TaxID=2576839 RepID=UPI00116BA5CE|nr:hypothetical protein [Pseudarthrobacter sp. NamE5]TLM87226.1 hypothetical protein FDW84_05375 [Pseudarthrobacter sp. NamE5]